MNPIGYQQNSSGLSDPCEEKVQFPQYSLSNRVTGGPTISSVSFELVGSDESLSLVKLPLPSSSSPAASPEPSVSSSAPVPSPTSDLSSWYEWIDTQAPLRDPAALSVTESSSSSEAPPAASSTDNKKRYSRDNKIRTTNPQTNKRTKYQRFPEPSLFHKYFETFFPVKSMISVSLGKKSREERQIKSIEYDGFGVPVILTRDNKKFNFDMLDVPKLKSGNNVMVFNEFTFNHIHAKVIEDVSEGPYIKYRMVRQDNEQEFLFEGKNKNLMYKLIPFYKLNKDAVVAALKFVWSNR